MKMIKKKEQQHFPVFWLKFLNDTYCFIQLLLFTYDLVIRSLTNWFGIECISYNFVHSGQHKMGSENFLVYRLLNFPINSELFDKNRYHKGNSSD